MECNKDEALRAKEIAETKFIEKDLVGAKKFALKAQNLFPGLESLSQFVASLEVYISAEKKINGEVDWYGVLSVDPSADDEAIRKNYRKLALSLHPDKNKSLGADGAFKIISEAWGTLSDKNKKIAYDQKRNIRGVVHQKVTTQSSSAAAVKNGFHSFTKNSPAAFGHQKTSNPQPSQVFPRPSKPNTFWTCCSGCLMHYEYLRIYLNQQLICPSCRDPFLAVEMFHPSVNQNTSTTQPSHRQHQNANHSTHNSSPGFGGPGSTNTVNIQQGPFLKPTTVRNSEKLKRRHEAHTGVVREEALQAKIKASISGSDQSKGDAFVKRRHIGEYRWSRSRKDTTHPTTMGHGGIAFAFGKISSGEKICISASGRPNSTRDLSQVEIRSMLMTKARMEIRKKLDEWIVPKASQKESRETKTEKPNVATDDEKKVTNGKRKEGDMNGSCINSKKPVQSKESLQLSASADSDVKGAEITEMNVPDPDFHDFDKDRTEKSFSENQVWAAYDEDDGMPRYYAVIQSVISKRPFKMRMSWLNSKSNTELGPMNWVGSGFPKTCGDFRIGKYEVNDTLNSFSHKVKWTKSKKGVIQIFPQKGDVWALYSKWSPDWNELTPDDLIHKYEMVQVLEDYKEEQGVTVAPLVKLAGFKSVFHQNSDLKEARTIPREEMFRFSHQVPSHLLTGQEAPNAPKGFLELDPAAMPLELLQVITESKKVESVKNEQAKEESPALDNSRRSDGKRVITYARKSVARSAKEVKGKEIGENTKEAWAEAKVVGAGKL